MSTAAMEGVTGAILHLAGLQPTNSKRKSGPRPGSPSSTAAVKFQQPPLRTSLSSGALGRTPSGKGSSSSLQGSRAKGARSLTPAGSSPQQRQPGSSAARFQQYQVQRQLRQQARHAAAREEEARIARIADIDATPSTVAGSPQSNGNENNENNENEQEPDSEEPCHTPPMPWTQAEWKELGERVVQEVIGLCLSGQLPIKDLRPTTPPAPPRVPSSVLARTPSRLSSPTGSHVSSAMASEQRQPSNSGSLLLKRGPGNLDSGTPPPVFNISSGTNFVPAMRPLSSNASNHSSTRQSPKVVVSRATPGTPGGTSTSQTTPGSASPKRVVVVNSAPLPPQLAPPTPPGQKKELELESTAQQQQQQQQQPQQQQPQQQQHTKQPSLGGSQGSRDAEDGTASGDLANSKGGPMLPRISSGLSERLGLGGACCYVSPFASESPSLMSGNPSAASSPMKSMVSCILSPTTAAQAQKAVIEGPILQPQPVTQSSPVAAQALLQPEQPRSTMPTPQPQPQPSSPSQTKQPSLSPAFSPLVQAVVPVLNSSTQHIAQKSADSESERPLTVSTPNPIETPISVVPFSQATGSPVNSTPPLAATSPPTNDGEAAATATTSAATPASDPTGAAAAAAAAVAAAATATTQAAAALAAAHPSGSVATGWSGGPTSITETAALGTPSSSSGMTPAVENSALGIPTSWTGPSTTLIVPSTPLTPILEPAFPVEGLETSTAALSSPNATTPLDPAGFSSAGQTQRQQQRSFVPQQQQQQQQQLQQHQQQQLQQHQQQQLQQQLQQQQQHQPQQQQKQSAAATTTATTAAIPFLRPAPVEVAVELVTDQNRQDLAGVNSIPISVQSAAPASAPGGSFIAVSPTTVESASFAMAGSVPANIGSNVSIYTTPANQTAIHSITDNISNTGFGPGVPMGIATSNSSVSSSRSAPVMAAVTASTMSGLTSAPTHAPPISVPREPIAASPTMTPAATNATAATAVTFSTMSPLTTAAMAPQGSNVSGMPPSSYDGEALREGEGQEQDYIAEGSSGTTGTPGPNGPSAATTVDATACASQVAPDPPACEGIGTSSAE